MEYYTTLLHTRRLWTIDVSVHQSFYKAWEGVKLDDWVTQVLYKTRLNKLMCRPITRTRHITELYINKVKRN